MNGDRTLPKRHKYRKCKTFLKRQSCVAPKQGWHVETFSSTGGQLQRLKLAGVMHPTDSCDGNK